MLIWGPLSEMRAPERPISKWTRPQRQTLQSPTPERPALERVTPRREDLLAGQVVVGHGNVRLRES